MTKYVFHIGSNQFLACAELMALLGEKCLLGVYKNFVLIETDLKVDQTFLNRFGSVISIYKVNGIYECENLALKALNDYFIKYETPSKLTFAICSNYLHDDSIKKTLKHCKNIIKSQNRVARFIVPKNTASISGVGVLNQDISVFGVFKFGGKNPMFYYANMIAIQNIDSYSLRDYSKPFRSAKLGMLPPKLAQIMINLALGVKGVEAVGSDECLYDPFCGTGTVLMEGMLMNLCVCGSDIDENNVMGTQKNCDWLLEEVELGESHLVKLKTLDATMIQAEDLLNVRWIVTEGFLGKPKKGNESMTQLLTELEELKDLYWKFLSAVAKASRSDLTVVLTLPVYRGRDETGKEKNFYIENLVEKLLTVGYTVSVLIPEKTLDLKPKETILYKRTDQKVYRQILRLCLNSSKSM